jgi:hypothetical protein
MRLREVEVAVDTAVEGTVAGSAASSAVPEWAADSVLVLRARVLPECAAALIMLDVSITIDVSIVTDVLAAGSASGPAGTMATMMAGAVTTTPTTIRTVAISRPRTDACRHHRQAPLSYMRKRLRIVLAGPVHLSWASAPRDNPLHSARGALQLKRPAPIPNERTSDRHSDPDGRSCNS